MTRAVAVEGEAPSIPGGVGIDLDALRSCTPDLILARDLPAGALTAHAGASVVALSANSLAEVGQDTRTIADRLGVPERGVQLVSRMRRRMQAVSERIAARPRPRVVCLEWAEPWIVAGRWVPELVALAGGEDVLGVAGAEPREVALEQVAAAHPDILILMHRGPDRGRLAQRMREMLDDARVRPWRALEQGQVLLVDDEALMHRPGPRLVVGLECLAEALHPGAFRFGHEGRGWSWWPLSDLEPGRRAAGH